MDYAEIERRLETELFQEVKNEEQSSERRKYEEQLIFNEHRYHARRSIKGLYKHGPDKHATGKSLSDPFPNAADVGSPIELTITQELIPNVIKAHLGQVPFTETKRMGERGLEPHGIVDDFLYYELARKAGIRPKRRKTLLAAYKYGEGIEKVIFEEKKRYVHERRTLLGRKVGDKKEFYIGPDNREVEVMGDTDEKGLLELAYQLVAGKDQRSMRFRYSLEVEKLDPQSALEAAGIEVKEDSIRIAPLKQDPSGQFPDLAMWDKAVVYEPLDTDINEEIVVDHGITIDKIHPKDFLWPSDATSNDIMEFWNCHRYNVSLEWLTERKGEGRYAGHGKGFFPEKVDFIVSQFQADPESEKKPRENGRTEPEIWEVYDRFVLNPDKPGGKDYLREVEIIAWFCPDNEGHPLLGWQVNPATRFPIHHIRPFSVYQVKPEDNRFHGLSIPETSEGFRDMMDWLINGMLNRSAMYSDPVTVMSPGCFEIEDNQRWGPGARWVKEVNETLDVMRYYVPEQQNMTMYQNLQLALRIMWGASEHLSGFTTKTDSRTLGEAEMISQKGSEMFGDTVESIAQTFQTQCEYIRCLFLYSGQISDIQFPVAKREREGVATDATLRLTKKLLDGQIFIKPRRLVTEADRQVKIQAILGALDFIKKVNPPMLESVQFIQQVTERFFDLINLEGIDLPSVQEMMQERAKVNVMVEKLKDRERIQKALEQEKNKGARRQVEDFLARVGLGATQAGQAGGPGVPPGVTAMEGVGG